MTAARVLAILLTLAACLATWIARAELAGLRGALAWDLRYVALGAAAFLFLTLAENLAARAAQDPPH